MNLKKLISVLVEPKKNENIQLPAPYVVPLLAEPTKEQLDQITNGDGNPIAEICQINSSAGLAFNYYKLFESQIQKKHKDFKVNFEDKVAKPLSISGGKSANLDVRYEIANEIHFVESKYLEPYYSGNEKITQAYLNNEYYSNIPNSAIWIEKFSQVNSRFKYLNVTQLYRHLLAIYRHYLENPQVYVGKQIVLESVSWKPTSRFIDLVEEQSKRSKSYFEKRIDCIEIEAKDAKKDINDFIKSLNGFTCRFEMKHYNDKDMLDAIQGAEKFNDFCIQYFFADKEASDIT